jgi:hypothetical protein
MRDLPACKNLLTFLLFLKSTMLSDCDSFEWIATCLEIHSCGLKYVTVLPPMWEGS